VIEHRLRALGEALSSNLTDEQRRPYAEFLDANELVLALEMLADWLSEDETPILGQDMTEMVDLARAMGNEEQFSRRTVVT
jgi:hypothetical protein